MKKKLYTVLTMACLLLVSSVSLVACGHEHDYASVWSKDETHHWHECTIEDCEEVSDKAEHTASDWITDTQATHATDGTKHKECTECGYVMETTIITATGHAMTTTSTYVVEDNKAYEVYKCSCGDTERRELSNYVVATVDTAQTLLDNAADGITIVLDGGNYGTLYLRKNDTSVRVSSTWAGGNPDAVWKRTIDGFTIIGTEGTNLTSLKAEAYTYAKTEHSLSSQYTNLICYMDITNLTIKNITFNLEEGDVAVDVACSGQHVSINGLTIDRCVVNCTGATKTSGGRLFASSETYAKEYSEKDGLVITAYRKNITISNCTMNDLYQGMRIYYAENLTIKNNQFNNIKGQNILLNSGKFVGEVLIEENTSTGSTERIIRMTKLEGNLIVRNNVVSNYQGEDTDMVKITDNASSEATILFEGNNWNGFNDGNALSEGKIAYPTE